MVTRAPHIRRTALAVLALPGIVAFLIPLLLGLSMPADASFRWVALLFVLPGTVLLVWCVREFHVRGHGTVAPWDPPRHLVASGPFRLSRNPMYLAVGLILIGWALGFQSFALLIYTLGVMAAFHLRVVRAEEPALTRAYRDEWTRYRRQVPRWVFRARRAVLLFWIAVALALPVGGLIYEAYADAMDAQAFPPPGALVDIGGRRLHLLCIGDGDPIVFFESSGWGTALSFAAARERIAARTTVCSYDRSGLGWSDPGPGVASAADLAREVAVLQDRAKLRAPSVVVASSIGGLTAEMFARQYPERVAGLVLLDAANSMILSRLASEPRSITSAACASSVLAHFGIIRLIDPFDLRRDESDEARRAVALTYNSRPWVQLCAMARALPTTVREFDEAPPLRDDIPLIVLSASSHEGLVPPGLGPFVDEDEINAALRDSHQQLAKLSARGEWTLVPDSTHLIAGSQPDAVADAVFGILDAVGR